MMRASNLGEALKVAGVNQRDVDFDIAIAKYLNSGGTIVGALARVNVAAARMSGMGHGQSAEAGHEDRAQTRQQVEGGEAIAVAPKGHIMAASTPSFNRGGDGQEIGAQSRHKQLAVPVREPSSAFRAALLESRKEAARTVLYRYRTSMGKWWGDVHPYEVAGMARDTIRGTALMAAVGALNANQMKMTFGQLLAPKKAEIAMKKADLELANVT